MRTLVTIIQNTDQGAEQSTDCLANTDAWLQHNSWIRIGGMPDLVLDGRLELRP